MMLPRKVGFVFAAGLLGATWVQASTVSARLDYFQGQRPLAARALIKPTLETQLGRLRLFGEGFLEADALSEIPYSDQNRARAHLQEAYAEFDLAPVTLRAGLQAVRWSESWSLPSLDFWTARRWDRYFLDPLPEQLKHPLGMLARVALRDVELELFGSARRPEDSYPLGLSELAATWEAEVGARAKFRVQGWDFTPVYAYLRDTHHTGFSLSYALQSVVPKLEVGRSSRGAYFVMGGADVFLGSWTVLPQVTLYRILETLPFEQVYYLPLRYELGRNGFEVQILSIGFEESFWGLEYRRTLSDTLTASLHLQD